MTTQGKDLTDLPLEKRLVGSTPAVSQKFIKQLGFIPFFPEDNGTFSAISTFLSASQDAETEVLEFLNEDVKTVLGLPYHEFWSQVIFDPSLISFVDTYAKTISLFANFPRYLRYSKRKFDQSSQAKTQFQEVKRSTVQQQLFRSVFALIIRMSYPSENQNDYMSKQYFLDLNKKHFIFDIPKLFDICALYADYSLPEVV